MTHAAKKLFIQIFLFRNSLILVPNHFGAISLRNGWGSKLYLGRWHIPLMFNFEEDWYLLDNGEQTNFYVLFRFHFLLFLC